MMGLSGTETRAFSYSARACIVLLLKKSVAFLDHRDDLGLRVLRDAGSLGRRGLRLGLELDLHRRDAAQFREVDGSLPGHIAGGRHVHVPVAVGKPVVSEASFR